MPKFFSKLAVHQNQTKVSFNPITGIYKDGFSQIPLKSQSQQRSNKSSISMKKEEIVTHVSEQILEEET